MTMDLPGCYPLVSATISTAGTTTYTAIENLQGMTSVTLEAELSGGTGGSAVNVLVQTRLGSGGTWRDIASLDFTTAAAKFIVVAAGTQTTMGAFDALSANTARAGFLGDQLRAVVTSTGTYVSSTLSVRASAR